MNLEMLVKTLNYDYGITGQVKLDLLKESPDNFIYTVFIDNIKTYVLRVSKRPLGEDVLFEIDSLIKLSLRGAPVIVPEKLINNEYYKLIDKSGICVLFKYIEGEHELVDKNNKPRIERVKSSGAALGVLHNSSFNLIIGKRKGRNIYTELDRVLRNENKIRLVFNNPDEFIVNVKKYINWAKNQKVDHGLINNDYRPSNVFFLQDKVSTILDFDWSCLGPYIKDVALGAVEWSYPDGSSIPWRDVYGKFIDGYNSISKIKITDVDSLYKWSAFACLSDASTYFSDLASEHDQSMDKLNMNSYMYSKFKYFKGKT